MLGKKRILGEIENLSIDASVLDILLDPDVSNKLKNEIESLYRNVIGEEDEKNEEQYLRKIEDINKTQAKSNRFKGTYDNILQPSEYSVKKEIQKRDAY